MTLPATMRAIRYRAQGPAHEVLRLEPCPLPQPGAGEVLVRVAASGLNPHDTKKRSGWLGGTVPAGGVIPHSDGAGEIVALGAGVPGARLGQRVFLHGAARQGYDGTAADYVRLPAHRAVPLPADMSFVEGAALGVPALTAWYAVLSAGPVAGQTVLVQGGSGAVGRMSIEMAKRGGAEVIATAGTAERLALARQAGADCVLNYRSDDVAATVLERTGGRGADLIVEVDFGANAATDGACVAENGRVASYSSTSNRTPVLDYYAFALKGVRLHFIQASNMPDALEAEASATISALLAEGALRPPVAHVFGLDRAATAHALLESGQAGGKVVLDLQAPAGA